MVSGPLPPQVSPDGADRAAGSEDAAGPGTPWRESSSQYLCTWLFPVSDVR